MKNEKGVTLIALVVTIIVLIILAAVSIAMLTGDSSLTSNAQQAHEDTKLSTAADKINMELLALKAIVMDPSSTLTKKEVAKAVKNLGTDYTVKIVASEADFDTATAITENDEGNLASTDTMIIIRYNENSKVKDGKLNLDSSGRMVKSYVGS